MTQKVMLGKPPSILDSIPMDSSLNGFSTKSGQNNPVPEGDTSNGGHCGTLQLTRKVVVKSSAILALVCHFMIEIVHVQQTRDQSKGSIPGVLTEGSSACWAINWKFENRSDLPMTSPAGTAVGERAF